MTHSIGTRDEWDAARRALLEREKELTRMSDGVARERLALPWVPVEKEYAFDTEDGAEDARRALRRPLAADRLPLHVRPRLGRGLPELLVDRPTTSTARASTSSTTTSPGPRSRALRSRSSLAYRTRMGWSFPWVSSFGNDFNFDFKVSSTDERPLHGVQLPRGARGGAPDGPGELPGMSAFALRDGVVYHTYSAYARGLDAMWGMYQWLDRAPLGRNEADGYWIRRHDAVRERDSA